MSGEPQAEGQGAAAGPSGGGGGSGEPGARVRCFSEVTPSDGRLDFQVIHLGRQLYVWVAVGGAKMANLCFSIASAASQARASGGAGAARRGAGQGGGWGGWG